MATSSHGTALVLLGVGWLALAGCSIGDLHSERDPGTTAGQGGQAAGGQVKGQRILGTNTLNPVWSRIAVYRPPNHFVFDSNANDVYDLDDRYTDDFSPPVGQTASPVAGSWTLALLPYSQIGLYEGGTWYLDVDGNEVWNISTTDVAFSFGTNDSTPLTGDWDGDGVTDLGYVSQGVIHRGFLRQETTYSIVVKTDPVLLPDIPLPSGFPHAVSGDWDGSGISKLAAYDGSGNWRIDLNGDGVFEDCPGNNDRCATWGDASHLPLAAVWTDSGRASIGSFRHNLESKQYGTTDWYFDLDGDFTLSTCTVDRCIDPSTGYSFGDANDRAFVGRWRRKLP